MVSVLVSKGGHQGFDTSDDGWVFTTSRTLSASVMDSWPHQSGKLKTILGAVLVTLLVCRTAKLVWPELYYR